MTLRTFCHLSKNWATSGAWRRGEAPLLLAGVLKIMGWDPKAHCLVFSGSSERKLHMNLAPFLLLVVVM